jgi:hypothetical protein
MIWVLGIAVFFLLWALIEGEDHKFGYHYLWIIPLGVVIVPFLCIIEGIYRSVKWLRMRWIYFRNPELKELAKLSGVKK